jgi:hypothetical protein
MKKPAKFAKGKPRRNLAGSVFNSCSSIGHKIQGVRTRPGRFGRNIRDLVAANFGKAQRKCPSS